eukprot:1152178-Pelagomonas_calceolata.AAC.3
MPGEHTCQCSSCTWRFITPHSQLPHAPVYACCARCPQSRRSLGSPGSVRTHARSRCGPG